METLEPRDNAMFLDVNELAVRKIRIRKSYAPGMLDFHSGDFRQISPLDVRATAELVEGHIRVFGEFHTRLELVCARCLEPVVEEISRDFDLFYRPVSGSPASNGAKGAARKPLGGEAAKEREEIESHLKEGDTEVGFFQGDGIFLTDILSEQVNLLIPMKVICRSDCRGLCPHCGANLNNEECRCDTPSIDPRLAQLARFKQDWSKKQ